MMIAVHSDKAFHKIQLFMTQNKQNKTLYKLNRREVS